MRRCKPVAPISLTTEGGRASLGSCTARSGPRTTCPEVNSEGDPVAPVVRLLLQAASSDVLFKATRGKPCILGRVGPGRAAHHGGRLGRHPAQGDRQGCPRDPGNGEVVARLAQWRLLGGRGGRSAARGVARRHRPHCLMTCGSTITCRRSRPAAMGRAVFEGLAASGRAVSTGGGPCVRD